MTPSLDPRRFRPMLRLGLAAVFVAAALPAPALAQGNKPAPDEMRWGLHVTLVSRWLDPAALVMSPCTDVKASCAEAAPTQAASSITDRVHITRVVGNNGVSIAVNRGAEPGPYATKARVRFGTMMILGENVVLMPILRLGAKSTGGEAFVPGPGGH